MLNAEATGVLIDAGNLLNSGSIAGTVTLAAGGYLDNLAGGVIQSSGIAVFGQDGPASVRNAGTILGTTGTSFGVELLAGGSVTNTNNSLIVGNIGVQAAGAAAATVTNYGKIVGFGIRPTGVSFAAASDRLIVEGHSQILGFAVGGGGTLELGGGAGPGTLNGIGTRYIGFANVVEDAGASWTLTARNTIANGGSLANAGMLNLQGIGALIDAGRVFNSGSIAGTVTLIAGGYLDNLAGGVIQTGGAAVYGQGGPAFINNAGTIAGSFGLRVGGTDIADNTIVNSGTVSGSGGTAVAFGSGNDRLVLDPGAVFIGTVDGGSGNNTLELAVGSGVGTLSGLGTEYLGFATVAVDAGADWTLVGNNTIATGASLIDAGTLTNTGALNAQGNRALIDAGILLNSGSIAGTATLNAGGYFDNSATGTIAAGGIAVYGQGSADVVKNAGTIAGGIFGLASIGPQTDVSNYGTISGGTGFGVVLDDGGEITNGAHDANRASISGGYNGVVFFGGQGTLANYGTISGGRGAGVRTLVGVSVTNAAGGAIVGGMVFSARSHDDGTLVNAGTITAATAAGVQLYRGGVVTNGGSGAANALIAGGTVGVRLTSYLVGGYYYTYSPTTSATRITNFGTISGQTGVQVDATVSAYRPFPNNNFRYDFPGNIANNTLVNGGTVIGSGGTAVAFGSGNDLLVVDPGALFVGIVDGGGGHNTLELAAGPGIGTLAGVGSQFVNFETVAVDAGADWTLTGSSTIAGGVSLANSGTLDITGTLDIAGAVTGEAGTAVGFGAGSNLLVLETSGVLSGAIDGFLPGETIDLRGVVAAGMTTLGAGNLLTIPESGGSTTLQLDPNQNYSQYIFRATSDGLGGADITVIADPGPTAGTGLITLGHGKTVDLTGFVGGLVTPGLPGDSDTLIAAIATHGAASVVSGMLSYTAPDFGGDMLTYTVANQFGETASGRVNVTVDPGPAAGTGATTLGHGKTVDVTGLVNGLITPGLAGDSETLISVSAAHGTARLVNGVVSYTAPASGPDTLTYTVADQYGDTATGTLNTTVDPGPQLHVTTPITLGHNQSANLTSLMGSLVFPGLPGDVETITAVGATDGTATLANGIITFTAAFAPPGVGLVGGGLAYTVTDQYGDTATGGVPINVDGGPSTVPGSTIVGHGQTVNLTSLVASLSHPALAGEADAVTAISAAHGTASLVNGAIGYTAPASGPDTLTYTVADQYGDATQGNIAVAVDPGPIAATGATTVGHGKTVNLTSTIQALVVPGIAGDGETITAANSAHGTANVANGIVSYTAPAAGTDTLSYTVADQYGDGASGTLNVTVDPGPTAGAGSVAVALGVSTDLTSYLLSLDTPGLSGDMLTLTGDNTTGTKGTISLVNGNLTYTAPTLAGSDSFGYTVSDQYGDSASATLTVSAVSLSHIGNGSGTIVLGDNSGTTSFGQGNVTVIAGDGNNSISGGNAGDTITAGNGNDTVSLGNGANTVTLGSGNDNVTVGNANNTITVAGAPSSVDTIKAGNGNNTMTLGAGTYNVTVKNGQNTFIFRNGGTYNITAGSGVHDLFTFTAPQGLLKLSFASNDELVFKNSGFDLGGQGTSSPQMIDTSLFSPNTDGTFKTTANRFAYNQSAGALFYDAQGSTTGSASIELALLSNKPALAATNLCFTS